MCALPTAFRKSAEARNSGPLVGPEIFIEEVSLDLWNPCSSALDVLIQRPDTEVALVHFGVVRGRPARPPTFR